MHEEHLNGRQVVVRCSATATNEGAGGKPTTAHVPAVQQQERCSHGQRRLHLDAVKRPTPLPPMRHDTDTSRFFVLGPLAAHRDTTALTTLLASCVTDHPSRSPRLSQLTQSV